MIPEFVPKIVSGIFTDTNNLNSRDREFVQRFLYSEAMREVWELFDTLPEEDRDKALKEFAGWAPFLPWYWETELSKESRNEEISILEDISAGLERILRALSRPRASAALGISNFSAFLPAMGSLKKMTSLRLFFAKHKGRDFKDFPELQALLYSSQNHGWFGRAADFAKTTGVGGESIFVQRSISMLFIKWFGQPYAGHVATVCSVLLELDISETNVRKNSEDLRML